MNTVRSITTTVSIMKTFSIANAFALSLIALGSTAYAAPAPKVPAALRGELIRLAKAQIKTLSRPVTLYHWTHRSDVKIPLKGYVSPSDPRFNAYLQRRYNSYFKPDPRNKSVAGTGLYLAVDPITTRSYGGRNWVLYSLELKKGARYLDTMGEKGFPTSVRSQMNAFGCDAFNFYFTWSKDSNPYCQAIRAELANAPELRIQSLGYSFGATTFESCRAHAQSGSNQVRRAFVVWSGTDFSPARSVGLITETPSTGTTRAAVRQIQGSFDLYIQTLRRQMDASTSTGTTKYLNKLLANAIPYPSIHDKIPTRETESWMKTHILGCDGYAEDQALP